MLDWVKQALKDVNKVIVAVGQTIHELSGSKRVFLGALAAALPVAIQLFPQYADVLNKALPYAEGAFAVLALLDTLRPLGGVNDNSAGGAG